MIIYFAGGAVGKTKTDADDLFLSLENRLLSFFYIKNNPIELYKRKAYRENTLEERGVDENTEK